MDQCIPHTIVEGKRNLPWLNTELTKSMRARNLAYKCAKRSGKLNHWQAFRTKRNIVANKLKQAKRKYFRSLNVSNPKVFWKATKFIMKKESRIPFLKSSNSEIISDDGEKASMLNNFFSQCFNSSLPALSDDNCSIFIDTDISDSNEELFCTEEEVLKCCVPWTHQKQQC